MSTTANQYIQIASVEYVDDHRLRIAFEDDVVRIVDFGPFLKKSLHPAIRRYVDKRRFKRFTVDRGHLHWNDFDLVFPLTDLYAGEIT